MDVDLRLVRSFVTVVEEDNVGRAARRLFISQPALSKQLQRLESILGLQLFRRDHRTLRLTPAGDYFFDRALQLLDTAAEITDGTREIAGVGAGRVIVAFVAGTVTLASTLLRTSQSRPDLDVRLLRVDWLDQTDCLHEGRANLALVRLPIDDRGLEHEVLISEPRVGGVAISHPLARRTALSIGDLDAEPIIRTGNQQDYWTVNPRPTGNDPVLGPLANTVEEMLAIVATGACMCITGESLARSYPRPDIVWVPIPDISPSCIAIAWRRSGDEDRAVSDVAVLAHRAASVVSSEAEQLRGRPGGADHRIRSQDAAARSVTAIARPPKVAARTLGRGWSAGGSPPPRLPASPRRRSSASSRPTSESSHTPGGAS